MEAPLHGNVDLDISPKLRDLPLGLSQSLLQVTLSVLFGTQLLLVTPLQQTDFVHKSL